jgi:carbamoyltransferase
LIAWAAKEVRVLVCGLKLTHDASVAIVEDGVLVSSVELEKLANRNRHTRLHDLDEVGQVLGDCGLTVSDVDHFVVDGWGEAVVTRSNGRPIHVAVAPYMAPRRGSGEIEPLGGGVLPISGDIVSYTSYAHVTTHVFSSYCTSPFATRGEDALVLVWDGGSHPCIFEVGMDPPTLRVCGVLSGLMGKAYPALALHLERFRELAEGADTAERRALELTLPGKVMALAGYGSVREDLIDLVRTAVGAASAVGVLDDYPVPPFQRLLKEAAQAGASDIDVFATFESFVGNELVRGLRAFSGRTRGLCLAGGSALNIKWNARIRTAAGFDEVWVPPMTNDSGSALGAACADYAMRTGHMALRWDVYGGPTLVCSDHYPTGWRRRRASVNDVAALLASRSDPIVVLDGPAELGPRALGNRSVLAPATDADMRHRLNHIKGREDYRPISPVCLQQYAPDVFEPGCPDPYMLFEHRVRDYWVDRVPAIVHVDGSARLQTVTYTRQPWLSALLEEYRRLTGIPLLCNTSANLPGRGFFPDVQSALRWEGAPYVWSDGMLYTSSRA